MPFTDRADRRAAARARSGPWFQTAILLAVLSLSSFAVLALPRGAAAGAEPDLTGQWSVSYSITCRASLNQEGAAVSGFIYCAQAKAAVFNGTIDVDSGDFSLSGEISGLPVDVEGTLDASEDTISGSWAFPPLFSAATFTGFRDPPDVGEGLGGGWTMDILSGACDAAVEHSGATLSADVECEGPGDAVLRGSLTGSFDAATGDVDLNGSVFAETELDLVGTLSADGDSINGTWSLDPLGLAGTFDAERQAAAATATPGSGATATPAPLLPPTGSGGRGTQAAPMLALLAGATALGGLTLVLASRRRLRS